MKFREAIATIARLTDPSMTRMEAFKVVEASGELDNLTWEAFKRLWVEAKHSG